MADKVPCPDCGSPKKRTAQRCNPCARAARRTIYSCGRCGEPVSRPSSRWCRACHAKNKAERETCSICGGWKGWKSKRCQACDQAARSTNQEDWHQIVQSFNPIAFRNEISRADLEWPIRQLATVAGISRTAIDNWLAGNSKPSRPELDAVLKALAFEPCRACNGLGHVDPTQAKQRAIAQRVTAQPSQAPRPVLRISVAPAAAVSVGRLAFDPSSREIRLDGAAVELTRSETAIFAALASNPDRLLTSAEIAQFACIRGAAAVRTHMGRLKPKLAQIGALPYLVSGQGSGIALSAKRERRTA